MEEPPLPKLHREQNPETIRGLVPAYGLIMPVQPIASDYSVTGVY
jgi:hypothetical protein